MVPLLDLDISHDGRPELFKEEVLKVLPYSIVNAMVILTLVPRILNVVEKILSRIYDLLTVIAIGVWLGVKHLVADANKLEVFPVCLALILWEFWSLLVALNGSKLLVKTLTQPCQLQTNTVNR